MHCMSCYLRKLAFFSNLPNGTARNNLCLNLVRNINTNITLQAGLGISITRLYRELLKKQAQQIH